MKICPECGNAEFFATGIQRHDWIVDGDGQFIDDLGCFDARSEGELECRNCNTNFAGPHELKEV